MDEYLTTGKAREPRRETTEVQCAYEVVGGRQAETGTKKIVPLELPTLVPTQIISYINSISLRLFRKHIYTNTDDEEHYMKHEN